MLLLKKMTCIQWGSNNYIKDNITAFENLDGYHNNIVDSNI